MASCRNESKERERGAALSLREHFPRPPERTPPPPQPASTIDFCVERGGGAQRYHQAPLRYIRESDTGSQEVKPRNPDHRGFGMNPKRDFKTSALRILICDLQVLSSFDNPLAQALTSQSLPRRFDRRWPRDQLKCSSAVQS
jgi:hypothetical protein